VSTGGGNCGNEYVWRYNHRDDDAAQFRTLIDSAACPI
jgi:hypothetical protein